MPRALMFQGTGSDVGKTVLVAGLCRAAKRRGIKVVPFKPQNMSNNAAVAKADVGEGEIGRGQWLQALACGVEPTVHMNPVLLKPQNHIGSQVVVQGKVWGNAKAREYLAMKPKLLASVMESFDHVGEEADLILVEGAGSPAEINLRAGDIANMGFASAADVPVVLIGDIDRGGVIASIVGTHTILPPEDRDMIVGYLINKFRGDISLFDDGLKSITDFTNWKSFGILPWIDAIKKLPAEDSVALDKLSKTLVRGSRSSCLPWARLRILMILIRSRQKRVLPFSLFARAMSFRMMQIWLFCLVPSLPLPTCRNCVAMAGKRQSRLSLRRVVASLVFAVGIRFWVKPLKIR